MEKIIADYEARIENYDTQIDHITERIAKLRKEKANRADELNERKSLNERIHF